MNKVLVLGAGQLARMMSLAGAPLNISISAYDVGSDKVVHPLTKEVLANNLQSAIDDCDVITAEFEHIPHDILDICAQSGKLKPSAEAIKTGGDRRIEKALLESAGVNSAPYHVVNTQADFDQAVAKLGVPIIFKSALAGYDGKGQFRLKSEQDKDSIWQQMEQFLADSAPEQAMVAEQFIHFDREVSLVGARNENNQTSAYPLAENTHTDGVLSVSLVVIEEENIQQQAQQMFDAVANALNYSGVLAIEFFQVGDKLMVNEIAPRVHNSGHWTQQGSSCCQFENHLRAVCNLPLGSTELAKQTVMINILGEDTLSDELYAIPGLAMHWYGKSKRPGRKMGHINISANDRAELKQKLSKAQQFLSPEAFPAIPGITKSL